jgi:hypothetical protein
VPRAVDKYRKRDLLFLPHEWTFVGERADQSHLFRESSRAQP